MYADCLAAWLSCCYDQAKYISNLLASWLESVNSKTLSGAAVFLGDHMHVNTHVHLVALIVVNRLTCKCGMP